MANLIITVISIALVAVAALMGVYYGGSAFMDGQTKANANILINQSSQLKTAYTIYLADGNIQFPNGQITVLNGTDMLTSNSKYISSPPQPPEKLMTGLAGSHNWIFNSLDYSKPAFSVQISDSKLCNYLSQQFTQSDPLNSDDPSNSFANYTTITNNYVKYGSVCYIQSSNNRMIFITKAQ